MLMKIVKEQRIIAVIDKVSFQLIIIDKHLIKYRTVKITNFGDL